VHVGPVTLRARFNAVATTPWRPDRDRVPRDPRADGPAFAAWVVASAAAFAVPGVTSVTFGDVDGTAASALRRLQGLAGGERLDPTTAPPQGIHLLAARTGNGARVLLANLGTRAGTLEVAGAVVEVAAGAVVERELP